MRNPDDGRRPAPNRFVLSLVTGALAAGLVGAVGASASPEATRTVHACVSTKDGLVRIVAEGVACANKEYVTTWDVAGPAGPQGPAGPAGPEGPQGAPGADAVIGDGSVLSQHLSQVAGSEAVTTATIRDGAVTDAKISSVDAGKVSGFLADATLSAGALTGTLSSDRLATGSIGSDKLTLATDKGGDPFLIGITGDHVEPRTLHGDRLAVGTVTTDESLANAASGQGVLGAILSIPAGTPAGQHAVLVVGQAEVVNLDPATTTWSYQLVRETGGTTTPIGSPVTVALREGYTVVPFSALDVVGAGTVTYRVELVTGSGSGTPPTTGAATVHAVDLGRTG